MEKELSSTLLRQLKRSKIDLESTSIPMDTFREFLSRIDAAYEDFKEREGRFELVCRQSSDEISNYISKLKKAEAINFQQQQDILNMLRYIKQGIFTIKEGRSIHPEYSDYTTQLLENTELAGRDVREVLLEKTSIDADGQQQILSALDFSIGANDLSFELNQHLLPRQLVMNFPEAREKTIEIDWTPIFNDQSLVEKILVSLRDVTAIRLLEKVNLNQQKELETLSQLLSASKPRFDEFHRAATNFLDQSIALVSQGGNPMPVESLQLMHRNLHTIKGNSRMVGFRGITNLVHDAEEHYKLSVLDKWNAADRLKDLESIRAEMDFYAAMAGKAFGQSESPEQLQRQIFVEKTMQILESHKNRRCTSESAVNQITELTLRFDYSPLEEILGNMGEGCSRLAHELGKLPPSIAIEPSSIGFHRNTHAVLESIFIHLIRNAIDHGIEAESERIERGKPSQGRVNISLERNDKGIGIRVQDDGRGLDLDRIHEKALQMGLLSNHSKPETGQQQLAQLIFETGLSTSKETNQISGRGMGMNAIQSLAAEIGGAAHIELMPNPSNGNAVIFIIQIPHDRIRDLRQLVLKSA